MYSCDCISCRREAVRSNCEREPLASIQIQRFGFRGYHEIDTAVVKLVNHVDETPRSIVLQRPHHWHVGNHYRMEVLRDLDVIIGRTWRVTELGECEPGDAIIPHDH